MPGKVDEVSQDNTPIRVTSWHGGNFAMVPQVVVREWTPYITSDGLAVYTVLCSHADNVTGHTFPKQQTIADLLGISVSTVSDLIADMAELGLLTVKAVNDRRGRFDHNEYNLCQPTSPTIPIEQAPRFRREKLRQQKREKQIIRIPSTAEIDAALARQVTARSQESNSKKHDKYPEEVRHLAVSDYLYPSRELEPRELDSEDFAADAAAPPAQLATDTNHSKKRAGGKKTPAKTETQHPPAAPNSNGHKPVAGIKRTPDEVKRANSIVDELEKQCMTSRKIGSSGLYDVAWKILAINPDEDGQGIQAAYSEPGASLPKSQWNWYLHDFRGRGDPDKGKPPEYPKPYFVLETYLVSRQPVRGNLRLVNGSNGNGQPRAAPMSRSDRNRQLLEEAMDEALGQSPPTGGAIVEGRVIRGYAS